MIEDIIGAFQVMGEVLYFVFIILVVVGIIIGAICLIGVIGWIIESIIKSAGKPPANLTDIYEKLRKKKKNKKTT